jgi:TonB family protein
MRAIVGVLLFFLVSCAAGPPTVAELCEGERTRSPEFIRKARVEPLYPQEARDSLLSGWVELEATISPNGEVLQPRILRSEPPGVFDDAALNAFQQWRYCPISRDGQPRVVKARLDFNVAP